MTSATDSKRICPHKLALIGIAMFFCGLTGAIHFNVEVSGFKANLNNAVPGAFVLLVGLVMTCLSVHSTVTRTEVTTIPGPQSPATIPSQEPGGNPPPQTTRTTVTEVYAHYGLREDWRKIWGER